MFEIQIIKKTLKEKKMSYIELSKLSGVPLNTIRKILAGITPNPRIDTMRAIEEALGLNEVVTEENFPLNLKDFERDIKNKERLAEIANLSPEKQKILFETLDVLLKNLKDN